MQGIPKKGAEIAACSLAFDGSTAALSVLCLLVTANIVTTSLIVVTLMMESINSSEMSALITATRRHIPEDNILRCHCRDNLNSYRSECQA
jgi:hypothetical protein